MTVVIYHHINHLKTIIKLIVKVVSKPKIPVCMPRCFVY